MWIIKKNKDIKRQLEELTVENERLRNENKKLRAENRELRTENQELRAENALLHKRIEELEATIEERINKAVEEAVAKATEPLLAAIAEKDSEIMRLKAQLNKDSTNSSKPPGSNGFRRVPNNREKSGERQGGQHGHKGVRLNIPDNLDELVESGKAEHVIVSEVPEGEEYVSDWTIDIKMVTVYTEYRRMPGKPPNIGYGAQMKALAVYLSVVGLIAVKRLSQFFHEISNNLITVSKAALAGFSSSAAEAVGLGAQVGSLLSGKVIHIDETYLLNNPWQMQKE